MKSGKFSRHSAIVCFAAFLITGCGNTVSDITSVTSDDGTAESVSVAETTDLYDKVPQLDFGGYEFRTVEQSSTKYSMYAEKENGDVINDTVYKRNCEIEERFHIKFLETERLSSPDIINMVKRITMSGSDEYDLIFGQMYESARAAKEGIYIDWNTVPYVTLSNPWYTKSIQDSSIGDKLYLLESDLVSSYTQQTWMMLFNKTKYESVYPSEKNLYEIVDSGKWTLDTLNSLVKDVYQDLNGNDKRDEEDFYGIASFQDGCQLAAFFYASGNKLAVLNADNTVTHTIEKEKSIDCLTKLGTLFNQNVGSVSKTDGFVSGYGVTFTLFSNEKLLFVPAQIGSLLKAELREFKSEFGVLPLPKYTEEQSEYYTCVDGGADILTIPITVSDEQLEIIGAVTEAMSCLSYHDFIPAYCGEGLSVKGTRDDESMAMVRKILDSRVIDFAYLYDGFSAWVMKLPDMVKAPDQCASYIASNKQAVDTYFTDFIRYMTQSKK